MSADAHVLEISGSHTEELTANAADLFVRVQGQSLVTGLGVITSERLPP